jgi:tRNA dimethylallyltransferase
MSLDGVLIAGPTASGKSAAATALAEEIGGTLINADSMQIYRELSVLTARPGAEDMARVPHFLYGHVSVQAPYSVGRYAEDAASALAEVRATGRTPIFAGGTGLYFTALTEGLADIPSVPDAVRQAVRARREELGPEAFFASLASLDPESGLRLRPSDTQRTLRAMEVLEATGKPLTYWQTQKGAPVLGPDLKLARFVLSPPRAALHAAINSRFEAMVEEGALEEARALSGIDPKLPAAKILGLRPLQALASGAMSREDALSEAKTATRQYAKRQVTWFRQRMADWTWLEPPPGEDLLSRMMPHIAR